MACCGYNLHQSMRKRDINGTLSVHSEAIDIKAVEDAAKMAVSMSHLARSHTETFCWSLVILQMRRFRWL